MTKLTFKDLKQQLAKLQSNTNQDNRLDVLRNKPFWIWNKQEHLKQAVESNQQCCFNYIVQMSYQGRERVPTFRL